VSSCSLASTTKELLKSLPARVVKKIGMLALRTNRTPAQIVESAIDYYERTQNQEHLQDPMRIKIDELVNDPQERSVFKGVMTKLAIRTASKMTPEERSQRARDAANARHSKATAKERSEAARKVAEGRWGKKKKDPDPKQ
jgi:hypothetical protein